MYTKVKLSYKTILTVILTTIYCILLANFAKADIFDNKAIYAYQFIEAKTGKVLLQHNPDQLMLPASTQKILTAYAAYNLLGDSYKFSTKLFYSGEIKNNILNGNLVIKFDGDPHLNTKQLIDLFLLIKTKEISRINGNIIIDRSKFDNNYYPHGWVIEDTVLCHSAPISAITINKNCFQSSIKLDNNRILLLYPDSYSPRIRKNAKIINNENKDACPLNIDSNDKNYYTLNGCYNKQYDNKINILNIAIQNPDLYSKNLIRHLFNKMGIKYNKIFINNNYKPKLNLIGTTNPNNIHDVMQDFLLNSRNYIGEVLIKSVAHKSTGKPGDWYNGINNVYEYLRQKAGISDIVMRDGSGYSRKNLVNATALNKALLSIYKDNNLYNKFIKWLPLAGKTGTLAKRFKGKEFASYTINAKTGYLENVSGLSGYIKDKQGRVIAFTLLANALQGDMDEMKNQEELILAALLKKIN